MQQQADDRLHQPQQDLEAKVAQPTAELEKSMTQMQSLYEATQSSEEQLRLAIEAADIGMWFWDLVKDELVWTARCKTLFGIDPNTEMNYDRFLAALHPDDRERTDTIVKQAIGNKIDYRIEYRSVWSDDSVHWLTAKGRAFYDRQGVPIRMMGIVLDITDRKNIEFALEERATELSQTNQLLMQATMAVNQRNQELDQFAHIVSHDLKAPLRAIANLSVWIEEDLADLAGEETQQHLQLLRARVYRMESLINGLLDYSRISYQNATCETFDLEDLLREVIDSLDVPPEFTIQLPSQLPTLNTYRLLLSQVLTNLIGNAVKHCDRSDGQVEITVQPHNQSCKFAVADNGPGIAPENHERVFGIFQTLNSRDTKESTGVGLAIVKKIIERLGGQIELESQVGEGATFRFTWPLTG